MNRERIAQEVERLGPLHFVEKRYAGDPTSRWLPNRACIEAMLRSSGIRIAANPEDEVYLYDLDSGDAKTDERGRKGEAR